MPLEPKRRMSLDDEQRRQVRDCLKRENFTLDSERFSRLVAAIEASMSAYQGETSDTTFRKDHDALRKLWELSHREKDELQIGVIWKKIAALPGGAAQYVNHRAPNVLRRLFPDQFALDAAAFANFQVWARDADPECLVSATAVITAESAKWVDGRSRGAGIRSDQKFEPVIFGRVRGDRAKTEGTRGGRPDKSAERQLVRYLAIDWLIATERTLEPGRTGSRGFTELVDRIFQWLELPSSTSRYALRRYWEEKISPTISSE